MALVELTVRNLAVIESVRISLAPGFNVVTGETGAGKSLVIDALALALGGRASADQVRAGSSAAHVEAIFDTPRTDAGDGDDPLAELIDTADDVLIVRREVTAEGRSVIRLNDRAVTVGTLAGVGDRLAEIHGQHEQQRLLKPEHQMSLLDRFGGHLDLVAAVTDAYRAWRSTQARMEELVTDAHELARRLELLEHQAGEIAAAALRVGEDAELEATLRAAQHGEAIVRAATGAVGALRGGDDEPAAVVALRAAVASLRTAAGYDERFSEVQVRAEGLAAEAEELARDVEMLVAGIDLDPASRERMEERLSLIYDMKRKYGDGIEAILAFGAEAESQLERLRNQDELRAQTRADEEQARAALETACEMLGDARRAAATRAAEAVNAELPPLGLRGGAFGVDVRRLDEPGPRGTERVEFTFAPNPGEPPRPLGRIASGGEASRLSLALKLVLASADETPVLVFDEVDAGVGGRNAGALGERLHALARLHQVLCVTHLPQIAAYADAHIVVRKQVADGRTATEARALDFEERRRELAAMLAGESAGEEAEAAAEALLRTAAAATA